jgi:hypothetical protein
MPNFEEKILAYLDGSLSEADRAEVLAKISGEHGSERALFDEHLRLQDLYSVARKPVSAPLALQQELASQIPVLAVKLPYLAALGERRNRFAAGWLGSLRSSWVNVSLLFASLLLIGGVWYAVKTNTHHLSTSVTNVTASGPSNSSSPNAASGNPPSNVAPLNVNASNANASNASAAHSNPSLTDASYSTGNRSYASHPTILHSTRSGIGHAGGMSSMSSSDVRNASQNGNNSNSAVVKGTSTTEVALNNSSTIASQKNIPVEERVASDVNHPIGDNPSNTDLADLPQLPLHSVDVDSVEPVSFHPQRIASIIYPDEGNSSDFVPLRVYALGGSRYLMPFSKQLSPYVNETKTGVTGNTMVPTLEAGGDYEITPWTSAGVRMGLTNFAQYQSFTHSSSSILFSQYSDDSVKSVSSLWCALAVTQTFNPFDKTQFSLSLAGGPAFVQPVAWLGMIAANISYDLSQTFMLRLGASYDIEQVKQSTAGISSEPNSTAGFITSSTGGALTSSAFGLNIGISFHP